MCNYIKKNNYVSKYLAILKSRNPLQNLVWILILRVSHTWACTHTNTLQRDIKRCIHCIITFYWESRSVPKQVWNSLRENRIKKLTWGFQDGRGWGWGWGFPWLGHVMCALNLLPTPKKGVSSLCYQLSQKGIEGKEVRMRLKSCK